MFGSKAIMDLSEEEKIAKMSVVSDSFHTECLILEKKSLVYISEVMKVLTI